MPVHRQLSERNVTRAHPAEFGNVAIATTERIAKIADAALNLNLTSMRALHKKLVAANVNACAQLVQFLGRHETTG